MRLTLYLLYGVLVLEGCPEMEALLGCNRSLGESMLIQVDPLGVDDI